MKAKCLCVSVCACADNTCFDENSKKDRNLVLSGKCFITNCCVIENIAEAD